MTKPKAGEPPTFEQVLTDAINRHAIDHLVKGGFSYRCFDSVRTAHERELRECRERTLEEAAQQVDHILRERRDGGGTYGDAIRALAARKDSA
jgi:hypothetical protein